MKTQLLIGVICYLIGGGFFVAWYVESMKMIKPGRVVDHDSVKWIMIVGLVFLSIGTTVFTHLIAEKIAMLFKGLRKDGDT